MCISQRLENYFDASQDTAWLCIHKQTRAGPPAPCAWWVGIKPACWPHLQAALRGCRERRKVRRKALAAPEGLRAPTLWNVNNLASGSGQAHATSGTVQGAHMSFRSSCAIGWNPTCGRLARVARADLL